MAGLLHFVVFASLLLLGATNYAPTWESLDTRPLPEWYDEAKIGIFLHWGVFSVPSFESAWFWYRWKEQKVPEYVNFMKNNYPPNFTYADFAPQFKAEFFDPQQWANIFKAAGAKYVVLTSKHHEGFTNWPSNNSWNWNSMDVGPNKDLVGALSEAIRTHTPDLHFGLYHSLYEWFNPLYLSDKAKGYHMNDFVRYKTMPELYDLVNTYQPEIVWSDGDWEAPDWYWNSTVFLAWLFNESPVKDTVVVNDRWGSDIPCHHGSYYNCKDRYNPGVLQPHKWENAMTIDSKAWTYRRDAVAEDFLTIQQLITEVVITVSCGGNILINTGPTPDGRISPIMEERLRQLGSWLGINGDGIYKTKPWVHQNDTATPGVWYTSNGEITYAFVLNWPEDGILILGSATSTENTTVSMMGYEEKLEFTAQTPGMKITFPDMSKVTSQWAWLLALTGIHPV